MTADAAGARITAGDDFKYLKTLVQFMKPRDYVVLYLFICLMALLISDWFARRLFRKTAMGSFREEE